jgi:hypothetical protein
MLSGITVAPVSRVNTYSVLLLQSVGNQKYEVLDAYGGIMFITDFIRICQW